MRFYPGSIPFLILILLLILLAGAIMIKIKSRIKGGVKSSLILETFTLKLSAT